MTVVCFLDKTGGGERERERERKNSVCCFYLIIQGGTYIKLVNFIT